jgi:hypothetical protein
MAVKISEPAEAGLQQICDDDRRDSFRSSIRLKLKDDPRDFARRCPAWPERRIWVAKIWIARIVFEEADDIIVWSITEV